MTRKPGLVLLSFSRQRERLGGAGGGIVRDGQVGGKGTFAYRLEDNLNRATGLYSQRIAAGGRLAEGASARACNGDLRDRHGGGAGIRKGCSFRCRRGTCDRNREGNHGG